MQQTWRTRVLVGALTLALGGSALNVSPSLSGPLGQHTSELGTGTAHTLQRSGATWTITDEVFDATGPDLDDVDPSVADGLRVAPVEEPAIAATTGVFGSGRATPGGDFSLPTDRKAWPDFTADLAGVRFTIRGDAVDVDIRYTSMPSPAAQLTTIAFAPAGNSGAPRPWPGKAGVASPWTAAATIGYPLAALDTAEGSRATPSSVGDHTVSVTLPLSALPSRPWAVTVGSGLADPAAALSYWSVPAGAPTPIAPGARGTANGVAVWDIAQVGAVWESFGERQQATMLATADLTGAAVDLSTTDATEVDGTVTRSFLSRYDGGDGIVRDPSGVAELGRPPVDSPVPDPGPMTGWTYTGQLQHYALHVPQKYDRTRAAPLLVYLHGFGGDVSEVFDAFPDLVGALSNEGFLVAAPLGRGDTFYRPGPGELDVLEAIADVRTHYAVDPDRIFLLGFSGGAAGVNVLTSRHPDLFAGAISAAATFEEPTLVNNIAALPWLGLMGEADPVSQALDAPGLYQALSGLGTDATLVRYAAKTHEFSLLYDSIELVMQFLNRRRDSAQPSITWVVKPNDARPALGLERGGAWWLSGTTVIRDDIAASVSASSSGLGIAPGEVLRAEQPIDTGGRSGRSAATLFTTKPSRLSVERENELALSTTNVSALAIDLRGAGLTTEAPLTVSTNSSHTVRLSLTGTGDVMVTIDGGPATLVRARRGVVAIAISAGAHTLQLVSPTS